MAGGEQLRHLDRLHAMHFLSRGALGCVVEESKYALRRETEGHEAGPAGGIESKRLTGPDLGSIDSWTL